MTTEFEEMAEDHKRYLEEKLREHATMFKDSDSDGTKTLQQLERGEITAEDARQRILSQLK